MNTYQQNYKGSVLIMSLLILAISGIGYHFSHVKPAIVPQVMAQAVSTPTPEVHYPPVEENIRLKFGVYADKAMQLLTDPACHENQHLDPLAVNDNTTWGGVGRDRGIFQISSYYHPQITDAMAFDYKTNIDYAYKMFVNDNFTFRRWTCGRVLGI